MDDKIKGTIKRIVQLTQQNPEFGIELRKALEIESSANFVYENNVPANVQAIRAALEIRANHSVNYEFIKEERLKSQFYIDNLRMENAALDLKKDDNERFYIFCVNAFYQVENIINYYYYKSYPDIKDLIAIIKESTKEEKYPFVPNGREEMVGDIAMVSKLNVFCNSFFPGEKIKLIFSSLRQVRNEGEHRWMTMVREKDDESPLYKFYKYNSFNSVRFLLIKLVNEVKKQLEEQMKTNIVPTAVGESIVEGTIASVLPSACFISVNGSNESVPSKLFQKTQGLKTGDKVNVALCNKKIINIEKV